MTNFSADKFHRARDFVKGYLEPIQRCETGKVIFDKKGAVTAKNERFAHDHIKLRVYNCPLCGGWHLTKRLIWTERTDDDK